MSGVYPWHARAFAQVISAHQAGRLGHGLHFYGPWGLGKEVFARTLTAYLLCQHKTPQGACGNCPSCHYLKAGTHGDLLTLGKENGEVKTLGVDDARTLGGFFATRTQTARVALLWIDQMTQEASNALLKTLEEPALGSYLLLISTKMPSATIKSRIQRVPLAVDATAAADYLIQAGIAPDNQKTLMHLAHNAPLAALELAKNDILTHQKVWLGTLRTLYTGRKSTLSALRFWQEALDIETFLYVSHILTDALLRKRLGVASALEVADDTPYAIVHLMKIQDTLMDAKRALAQNAQEDLVLGQVLEAFVK